MSALTNIKSEYIKASVHHNDLVGTVALEDAARAPFGLSGLATIMGIDTSEYWPIHASFFVSFEEDSPTVNVSLFAVPCAVAGDNLDDIAKYIRSKTKIDVHQFESDKIEIGELFRLFRYANICCSPREFEIDDMEVIKRRDVELQKVPTIHSISVGSHVFSAKVQREKSGRWSASCSASRPLNYGVRDAKGSKVEQVSGGYTVIVDSSGASSQEAIASLRKELESQLESGSIEGPANR